MKLSRALGIGLTGGGLQMLLYAIAFSMNSTLNGEIFAVIGLSLVLDTAILNLFFGSKFPRIWSFVTTTTGAALPLFQLAYNSLSTEIYLNPTSQLCIAVLNSNSNTTPAGQTCLTPAANLQFMSCFGFMGFAMIVVIMGFIWIEEYKMDVGWAFLYGLIGLFALIGYNIYFISSSLKVPTVVLTPMAYVGLFGIVLIVAGIVAAAKYDQSNQNEQK
jgi:hypothetical protein